MSHASLPMAPATYLLTDGVEMYARRTGPLNSRESFREPGVTAVCDLCERRQLRRHLVKKLKLGTVQCFGGCRSADAYTTEEAKLDASIDALHLPHETMRSKMMTPALRLVPAPPRPGPDSAIVINTCRCCGRADTEATWRELDLLSAQQVTEDGVTTTEEQRNCVCGSTRMVVSDREGKRMYPARAS